MCECVCARDLSVWVTCGFIHLLLLEDYSLSIFFQPCRWKQSPGLRPMACGLLEEGAGLGHVCSQQATPGTSCEDVLAKRILERKELSPLSLKPASRHTWRAH